MPQVNKWSNVRVQMQSALGVASEPASISKANPGVLVIGSPTIALSNGDWVVLTDVEGMSQVDGRVFRVSGASGANINLEGEDTSLYDDFTEGLVQKITFGTNLATATGLTAAGGDFDFLDVTTIHDNTRKQVPGLPNAASYTFENLWDVGDAALRAMKTASDNQAQRAFLITFATGALVAFNGYVGATLLPIGNALDIVKTSAVVTMFGRPTIYEL